MAVQAVCPIGTGNTLATTVPYSEQIIAAWKVTAQGDDEVLVIRAQAQAPPFNLPKENDLYVRDNESSVRSRAQRINVSRMGSATGAGDVSTWLYQVTYGTKNGQGNKEPPPGDPLPGDENPDPTARPMRYWVEYQPFQRRIDKDVDGNDITNSAGLPFTNPPPTRDESLMVQVCLKNFKADTFAEYTSILDMIKALKSKANSAPWFGQAADHVLMLPPQMSPPRFENETLFYEVTFRGVIYDSPNDEIFLVPLDLGTSEIQTIRAGQGDERKIHKEATDGLNAYTGTVKLDGYGKILADQTQPAIALDGGGAPARKGPFRKYAQVDFNTYVPTPT